MSAAHLTHDPQSSDMALRAPPIITAMTQAPLVSRRTGDVCLLPELWSFYTPPKLSVSNRIRRSSQIHWLNEVLLHRQQRRR